MKSIFLLHGDDNFSSSQKLKAWRDGFVQKYNSEAEIFEGKKLDLAQFETNIETYPFLSEKRLVIIKNFISDRSGEDGKRLSESLKRVPDFCILILHENGKADKRTSLYKKLLKESTVEEFKEKTPLEISRWAADRAKKKGLTLALTQANYFAEHCGTNLWQLENELDKLALHQGPVTNEVIDNLTTPSLSASIFRVTDKVAEKNAKEALKTLKTLQDNGEDMIKILFMIVRHFRILIQIHDLVHNKESSSSIASKLKQAPFVIQKGIQQSRNFTHQSLKKIYGELLKIDTDFKTGKIKIIKQDNRELHLAIEKFIINCCQK